MVESFRDRKFEGKVYRISPYGVEKENVTTFEVQVSIHNPGRELKANMSANAEIILEEKLNVLLVPEAAVVYDKDRKASVEVPDATAEKGRKKLPVKLGISNGVKTELIAGLERGPEGDPAIDSDEFRDLIADTIQTLLAHKMRAGLTMFGLMWGVVSITLMTAAGDGLREGQAQVARQFGEEHHDRFPGADVAAGGRGAGGAAGDVDDHGSSNC